WPISYPLLRDSPCSEPYTLSLHDALPITSQTECHPDASLKEVTRGRSHHDDRVFCPDIGRKMKFACHGEFIARPEFVFEPVSGEGQGPGLDFEFFPPGMSMFNDRQATRREDNFYRGGICLWIAAQETEMFPSHRVLDVILL